MPTSRRTASALFLATAATLCLAALRFAGPGAPPVAAAGPREAEAPFPVAGTLPGTRLVRVATGLDNPTFVTHFGDDRLVLTLRDGKIVILAGAEVLPTPFLDISNKVGTSGEGGLLSVAFHPRYAENGFFYVDYTDRNIDTVIARYRVSANDPDRADPASETVILRIQQPPFDNHKGGQLQFGPDGYLYIGMGDGGSGGDPNCFAQRDDTLLGKLLRIDVDHAEAGRAYAIPPDNPFRGAGGPPDEAWAVGTRNPWRFSFDRATGDLWIGDVGQGAREEIDLEPAASPGGRNYGWKVMEGTACFGTGACPATTPPCGSPALTLPVLEYLHTGGNCSVTGGYVYRGTASPALAGIYFFGDFCSGQVWAADRQGGGFRVRAVAGEASQLTTFGQDRRGELYLATLGGDLFRIAGPAPAPRADTVGLYDPARSRFLLKAANQAGPAARTVRFGTPGAGWLPLAGDWDGDGRDTIGLYDPERALFLLRDSLTAGPANRSFRLGPPGNGWLPLAGDWDGDGRDGVGLYDPETSTFRLKNALSAGGFDRSFRFGLGDRGWTPIAGDWNADGRDGIGLYDPATATFRLRNALSLGPVDLRFAFGAPGRLPLAGDWNADGRDGVGTYAPGAAVFALRNALSAGPADASFPFGTPGAGWRPLAGKWALP